MSAERTRARILDAARRAFARGGFEATSVRSIAALAGVDQALVHHYFGTKRQLFLEAIEVPMDPAELLAPVLAAPREQMGEAYLRAVLGLWDSEAEPALVSTLRTLVSSPDGQAVIGSFALEVALRALEPAVDDGSGSARLRLSLVASQTVGLILARKVARIEPIASMAADDLAALAAPTIQRYMTGELPG